MNELAVTREAPPRRYSVLGERPPQIKAAGHIRAGIKVLTAAAAKHPKAQDIYDRGVAAGAGYDAIEHSLRKECGFEKCPLTPRNVDYFRVSRSDFSHPEIAEAIIERYGEDRGDGVQLYRFPVVFAFDDWQQIMPHGLKCYSARGLRYWSEYDDAGVRWCKTRQPVQVDARSRRATRPWGGRKAVLRPENGGRCDPEQCAEYQKRDCNLAGRILFYVPGIPGTSLIDLATTSFYGMEQFREQLELVNHVRGRVSGTHEGRAIFAISKVRDTVAMLDPATGEPKRVKQWIVRLEADLDMSKVFASLERPALAGASAAAALAGPAPTTTEAGPAPADTQETPPSPGDSAGAGQEVRALREQVDERLRGLCETIEDLAYDAVVAWLADKIGPNWGRGHDGLMAALDLLEDADNDPDDFAARVCGTDCPF